METGGEPKDQQLREKTGEGQGVGCHNELVGEAPVGLTLRG